MTCYNPIIIKNKGYTQGIDEEDKKYLLVECGKCLACREKRKKRLIARTMHEAQYWKYKYFILFTYGEKCDFKLHKEHMQAYLKRLRKWYSKKDEKFAYLISGEYGEGGERPHYHMILMSNIKAGDHLQRWEWGTISFGKYGTMEAGIQSIYYTAGYTTKKMSEFQGKANETYADGRPLPFLLFSKGLGKRYAQENKNNFAEKGIINLQGGNKVAIPRYYKKFQITKDWTEDVKKEIERIKDWYIKTYKLDIKDELDRHVKTERKKEETLAQRERIFKAKYKQYKILKIENNLKKQEEEIKESKKRLDEKLEKWRRKKLLDREEIKKKKINKEINKEITIVEQGNEEDFKRMRRKYYAEKRWKWRKKQLDELDLIKHKQYYLDL